MPTTTKHDITCPNPKCKRKDVRFRSTLKGREFICRICGHEWPKKEEK